jgi:hypothetical protein
MFGSWSWGREPDVVSPASAAVAQVDDRQREQGRQQVLDLRCR